MLENLFSSKNQLQWNWDKEKVCLFASNNSDKSSIPICSCHDINNPYPVTKATVPKLHLRQKPGIDWNATVKFPPITLITSYDECRIVCFRLSPAAFKGLLSEVRQVDVTCVASITYFCDLRDYCVKRFTATSDAQTFENASALLLIYFPHDASWIMKN